MKAILQHAYGTSDVYQLGDAPAPAPAAGEVLVRVRATSLHADIWHAMRGIPYILRLMGGGFRRPRNPIPGIDLAGEVVELGSGSTRFQVGDRVFGQSFAGWNLWQNGGTFAEYAAVPESVLDTIPDGVDFPRAAAAATSGLIVLLNLDLAALGKESRVLLNGAGGGVGTIALQIIKSTGAEVTAVDGSDKLDMLRSLGADHVIDYAQEDFTRSGVRYDLVFDIVGNKPLSELRRVIRPKGTYLLIGHDDYGRKPGRRLLAAIPQFLGLALRAPFVSQNLSIVPPKNKETPLVVVRRLLQSRELVPAVDEVVPLEGVHEAMARLESGRVKGKIVIAP